MGLTKANKISVVGNSGAGKSTLSKELAKSLGIEVYSIDIIYWQPGWKLRGQDSFKTLHEQWLEKDSWIIEGVGYWGEMERRMSESDIVIFLDVPVDLCKKRAEIRIKDEKISSNPNITEGCMYSDVKELQFEIIDNFHGDLRPKLVKYLSSLNPEKVRVVGNFSELNIDNET